MKMYKTKHMTKDQAYLMLMYADHFYESAEKQGVPCERRMEFAARSTAALLQMIYEGRVKAGEVKKNED